MIVLPQAPKAQAPGRLPLVGVNVAGAEFKGNRIPGQVGKDYVYPSPADLDYFIDRGLATIRLPFRWERLQRNLGWPLDAGELARIDAVVAHVGRRGGTVVLDPHNYARYHGRLIGSPEVPNEAYAGFWRLLAAHYRDSPHVAFGIMNEPHGISAPEWRAAAEAAIAAIREAGARNLVLVPGTAWTGAHSWLRRPREGGTNGDVLASLEDPGRNMAFEVHQYLDRDSSGTDPACRGPDAGVAALAPFTDWLRRHGHRGFLGEFGVGPDPVCLEALDRVLRHMGENADVWLGWTYWAAGAWWGDYPFSVQPGRDGAEKPQIPVLLRHAGPGER